VFALATVWLVAVLADLTIPPDFRPAVVMALVIWAVAILWYLLFIRGRVRRGEAATALRALGVEVKPTPAGQAGGE
jgi:hypothetical protein